MDQLLPNFSNLNYLFLPWSLDLIPLIFNDIPSANRLVNQSKININMVHGKNGCFVYGEDD